MVVGIFTARISNGPLLLKCTGSGRGIVGCVQLSTDSAVVAFDLFKLCSARGSSAPGNKGFPKPLQDFIELTTLVFVGVGVFADATNLRADFCVNILKSGTEGVRNLAVLAKRQKDARRGTPNVFVQDLLDHTLSGKSSGGAQCSDRSSGVRAEWTILLCSA